MEVEDFSDRTERGKALLMRHQVAFPPAVLLDGELFSYGRLSERKLRRKLDLCRAAKTTGAMTVPAGPPEVPLARRPPLRSPIDVTVS